MFDTPVTFKVVKKDPELRLLEVMYDAEGYEPVLVSMLYPKKGSNLDEFFRSHAPISVWEAARREVEDLDVGFSGVLLPVDTTPSAKESVLADTPLSEKEVQDLLAQLRGGSVADKSS